MSDIHIGIYNAIYIILLVTIVRQLFGATGYCAASSKLIPAFEMVIKAKENVYHLECFACQQCNHRLVRVNLIANGYI